MMYKLVAFTLVAIAAVSLGGNPRDYGSSFNNRQTQPQYQSQYQTQNQQFHQQRQYQQSNQQYNQQQPHVNQQYQPTQQVHQQYQPQRVQSNYNQQHHATNLRKLTRDDTPEANNPLLSPKYLQAFREFTLDLLTQSYFDDAHEKTGVVAYSTFTVGHLLSVINERVLNVPNAGIQRALKLSGNDVPIAYAGIVNTFLEDPKIEASSYFYTPDANLQVTPNYPKLHVEKQVLQLFQNPRASGVINDDIKRATHGVIDNEVLPEVPPFNQSAAGVFSNTVYYNSRWVHPFTQVGQRPFNVKPQKTVQVETLEVTANLPVTVHQKYSAVAIPLEGGMKHIVLVQPRGSVKQFIKESVADIFLHTPQSWKKEVVRVQVPALNFTVGRNFVAQLNDLAGSEIQCPNRVGRRDDAVPVHYLQPVVQVYSSFFTADGFELAAANGVQVNQDFNADHFKVVKSGHDTQDYVQGQNQDNTLKVKTVREIDAANAATQVRSDTEFVFNKPYFVYAHDVKLGAVSFTAVKTPVVEKFQRTNVQNQHYGQPQRSRNLRGRSSRHILTHDDFDEETKQYRWNCGVHNDHNMEHDHDHGHGHGHGHGPAHPSRPVVQPTTPVPTCAPAPVQPVQQGSYY